MIIVYEKDKDFFFNGEKQYKSTSKIQKLSPKINISDTKILIHELFAKSSSTDHRINYDDNVIFCELNSNYIQKSVNNHYLYSSELCINN